MNFAVLLAADSPKHAGMPSNWPVELQPIGDAKELPPEYRAPWRFATGAQVAQWKANHADEIAEWNAAREAAATQPKRDRETAIAQAIQDLNTIRDSSGTLTAAQVSNALRALAKAVVAIIEELRP